MSGVSWQSIIKNKGRNVVAAWERSGVLWPEALDEMHKWSTQGTETRESSTS